ncbi:MAG: hypothetical protein NC184_06535 [Roseburia sp.]|nr:hypothetical protein [Roseburia sp.]
MEKISISLTPALTILLVGMIVPWIISVRKKAEKIAIDDKCVCYSRSSVIALWITFGAAVLLTVAALVCTVLSIIDPEMMHTSSEDTAGIVLVWVLCIALDVFTIVASIMFMRKITYNSDSFTDFVFYKKERTYLYKDITKLESAVKMVYGAMPSRIGKLKIYFGEKCVKIPARMFGIIEFIAFLQTQCPNLSFN